MNGSFSAEGVLLDRRSSGPGWVTSEDGVVTGIGHGACPVEPDVVGFIVTDVVNMHTHCADYGLEVPPGLSLEELVAPPDGLKHRYLRGAPPEELRGSMVRFSDDSRRAGSAAFIDFREGGLEGCRMLRAASPDAVILGRPVSPEFDPEEVSAILDVADGIGISSISDMDPRYAESLADAVRERGMILGIHASERIREDIDEVLSLDPAFVVHMCEASDNDLVKCAEAEVPVVLCPTSNGYFGRRPPAARAATLGVDLALGTDNGMLRSPDMFSEAAVLAAETEAQGGDPEDALTTLVRLSGKILNPVRPNHPQSASPCPVTVLPSPSLSAAEALRGRTRRIRLEGIGGSNNDVQEHSRADRR